jgi:formamidopyrimidine-DNA glycosylase
MPELPEVEAARIVAEQVLGGRTIARVAALPDPIVLVRVTPRQLSRALVGRRVLKVARKGKHLWLELDRRPWPALHLGMSGALHARGPGRERPRFWKLEITADDGSRLVFTDVRRFGRVRLLQDPPGEPPISLLGSDPLEGLPAAAALRALLQRRGAPIKAVLLDQSVFAGVGNWIADEVLFQARLDPHRPAASLSPEEVRALRRAILGVITTAVRAGADSGRFPRGWLFHHRWGRSRSARSPGFEGMVRETIGGRTAAWVPGRQR